MALLGVGMGLIVSQLGNVVQSSVDASGRGEAGGLQYTGQQLGSSVGVALIGAIVFAGLTNVFVQAVESDERIAQKSHSRLVLPRGMVSTSFRATSSLLRPSTPGSTTFRPQRSSRTTRTPSCGRSRPACW